MSQEYPWYESVEGDEIQQGDFIDACKVVIPKYSLNEMNREIVTTNIFPYEVESEYDFLNIVIVNQSCDLYNKKIDNVLVCQRWSYKEVVENNPKFKQKQVFDRIRKGQEFRYCLLGQCDLPDLLCGLQLVDFNTVYSIPRPLMEQMALSKGKRLRLCSPYREKLAQDFAFFHMRIGLRIDLPSFEEVFPRP